MIYLYALLLTLVFPLRCMNKSTDGKSLDTLTRRLPKLPSKYPQFRINPINDKDDVAPRVYINPVPTEKIENIHISIVNRNPGK